jgi:hypothetical protein
MSNRKRIALFGIIASGMNVALHLGLWMTDASSLSAVLGWLSSTIYGWLWYVEIKE